MTVINTAHALAKKLLEQPDMPLAIWFEGELFNLNLHGVDQGKIAGAATPYHVIIPGNKSVIEPVKE